MNADLAIRRWRFWGYPGIMNRMIYRMLVFLLGAALFSGGCALRAFPEKSAEFPYPLHEPPGADTIVHVATGTRLTRLQLFSLLSDAGVVYISESHNNLEAHRVQAEIIEAMVSRFPGQVAVGLEMFPYSAQQELDEWSTSGLDARGVDRLWSKYWNVDVAYYQPLIEVLQRHRTPVIGLNAPKSLVREVSEKGVEGISADLVGEAPEIDLTDPYQKEFLRSIYAGHMQGSGMLDRFVLIQALWEETMAKTAAEYLQSEKGRDKKLIILAGGHHINYGFGIPRRLFRRLPRSYFTVNPEVFLAEEIPEEELMDVDIPAMPLRVSDFYWYTPYIKLELKRPMLGVMLRAVSGGLEVVQVMPDSLALRAGLVKGDIIEAVNGERLEETGDLRFWLRDLPEGAMLRLDVNRNGEPVVIEDVLDGKAFVPVD